MKFSSIGRKSLASLVALSACLGVTACSRNYTVAFLYSLSTRGAGSSPNGVVNIFHVDYQSGALVQLADSPVDSLGQSPSALVATANQKNLFVTNYGPTQSTVVWFRIGTDGKLYAQPTPSPNIFGTAPVAVALSGDNTSLYVLSSRRPGASAASAGGVLSIFPIAFANGDVASVGTPTSVNVGINPIGVVASQDNKFVYVVHQDAATSKNLIGFSRNVTTGALTLLPGSTVTGASAVGYSSGITPSAITEDPKSRYIYVTDQTGNQIVGYTLSTIGEPTPMNNGPFQTGSFPVGITIDPRGKYLYTANYNSNSISAYAIDTSTGTISNSIGSTSQQTGTGPTCVTIENALGTYLFTSNRLDGTITGLQLNASTGSVKNIQGTPFNTSSLPSCAVAVANGEHATQIVQ